MFLKKSRTGHVVAYYVGFILTLASAGQAVAGLKATAPQVETTTTTAEDVNLTTELPGRVSKTNSTQENPRVIESDVVMLMTSQGVVDPQTLEETQKVMSEWLAETRLKVGIEIIVSGPR